MKWFDSCKTKEVKEFLRVEAVRDAVLRGPEVAKIFGSLKVLKTASSRTDLHVHVDPNLIKDYNINLHLITKNDEAQKVAAVPVSEKKEAPKIDVPKVASTGKDSPGFTERTIAFPAKQLRDPNYLCSIVLQNVEGIYVVSSYMIDTYLGQYVFKSNYYFRENSRGAARGCFDRVLAVVDGIKNQMDGNNRNQNAIPYLLRRALQDENGEIEHRTNKIAVYLDPQNVPKQDSIGAENILIIPTERPIGDDLLFARGPK